MFTVSKALLTLCVTVIVRARGAIWLNPFATVLFNAGSAVIVECCVLYPCCVGMCGMFAPVHLQLLRGGICVCMMCPCLSLLCFGIGTMLANFHMYCIMSLLRAIVSMLVRNASLIGPMYFRCLFVLCVACLTV